MIRMMLMQLLPRLLSRDSVTDILAQVSTGHSHVNQSKAYQNILPVLGRQVLVSGLCYPYRQSAFLRSFIASYQQPRRTHSAGRGT